MTTYRERFGCGENPCREHGDPDRTYLTFAEVAEANRVRCAKWHDPTTEPWTGADWSNAMCGEAGEAANVVKKLRRCETGTSSPMDPPEAELRAMLAHEIADVLLYAFLLADHYGIEVAPAVIEKFNIVSERQGFPDRLGRVDEGRYKACPYCGSREHLLGECERVSGPGVAL